MYIFLLYIHLSVHYIHLHSLNTHTFYCTHTFFTSHLFIYHCIIRYLFILNRYCVHQYITNKHTFDCTYQCIVEDPKRISLSLVLRMAQSTNPTSVNSTSKLIYYKVWLLGLPQLPLSVLSCIR